MAESMNDYKLDADGVVLDKLHLFFIDLDLSITQCPASWKCFCGASLK